MPDNVKSTLNWTSAARRTSETAVGRNTGNPKVGIKGNVREDHHRAWAADSVLSASLIQQGPLADRAPEDRRGMSCAEGGAITRAQQQDMAHYETGHGSAVGVASPYQTVFNDDDVKRSKIPVSGNTKGARKRMIKSAQEKVAGGIHENDLAAINKVLGKAPGAPIDATDVVSQRKIHIDTAIRKSGVFTTIDEDTERSMDACAKCRAEIVRRMG